MGDFCTVLGSDWQIIEKCVSKCQNHTEIRWNVDLTLESIATMRAQYLHLAFPFHRPKNCLLEPFANVKCCTDLTLFDHTIHIYTMVGLGMTSSPNLNLTLPPTVRSLISF